MTTRKQNASLYNGHLKHVIKMYNKYFKNFIEQFGHDTKTFQQTDDVRE